MEVKKIRIIFECLIMGTLGFLISFGALLFFSDVYLGTHLRHTMEQWQLVFVFIAINLGTALIGPLIIWQALLTWKEYREEKEAEA